MPIESTDYSGQKQLSEDNGKSDGARLITSLSSCIIGQSTCAASIDSMASYSRSGIHWARNVYLVFDDGGVAARCVALGG